MKIFKTIFITNTQHYSNIKDLIVFYGWTLDKAAYIT